MSIFHGAETVSIDGKDVLKIEMDGVTVWEKFAEIIPTKIHLTLTSTLKQQLSFIYSGSGEIDWGDGSEVAPFSGSTTGSFQHTYPQAGEYVVSVKMEKGGLWIPGTYMASLLGISMLSFSNDGSKSQSSPQLTAVEFGDGAALYRSGKSSGYAFAGCISLTEFNLPEGETTVPTSTFQDCVALRQVTFPVSVTSIEAYAFARCAALSPALEMPFQRIAACAFRGCTGLEKVWLRSSVETLEESSEKSNNTVSAYTGPFYGCSPSLVIYCEADEKPSGWSEHWNVYEGTDKFLTVVWGQKTRPW